MFRLCIFSVLFLSLFIKQAYACNPETNTLYINEINWVGTIPLYGETAPMSYGRNYQWIELYNSGETPLSLDGYSIVTDQGLEILLDDSQIAAKDFLLLQNTETEIFGDESVIPDLYYTDLKDEEGKKIRLSDETSNMQLLDSCDNVLENIPNFFSGDYSSYRTMARLDTTLPSDEASSWFHEQVNGSPKQANEYYDVNLSIASITANPYYPEPNNDFIVDILIANLAEDDIPASHWSLELFDEEGHSLGIAQGNSLENYADTTIVQMEIPALEEGTYTFSAAIICNSDNCGEYSTLDTDIEVKLSPFISEIYPKPDETEEEWIELYNPLETNFGSGTEICKQLECITLLNDIPAKDFLVIHESNSDLFEGDWFTLTNSNSTITWKESEWVYNDLYDPDFDDPEDEWIYTETLIDSFAYMTPLIRQIFLRQEHNKAILASYHVTEGKINNSNQSPTAVINIQNTGKNSGYAPFSFNITGESSADPDGDDLEYFWDFGNGHTSTESNPLSFSYNEVGIYNVQLTVNDGWGGIATATVQVKVSRRPSGGESSPAMLRNGLLSLAHNPFVKIQKLSVNDSEDDWIEIACPFCVQTMNISGYQLYDDKTFFIFPENTFIDDTTVISLHLLKDFKALTFPQFAVEKKMGLTKTDEQILLLNAENNVVDALCWNNQDETLASTEKQEEQNLKTIGAWQKSCINSKPLERPDMILVRKENQDSNTEKDWNIVPKGLENIQDLENKDALELFISLIDINNGANDIIEILCKKCDADLQGWTLNMGATPFFTFPEESVFHSGDTIRIIFGASDNLVLSNEYKESQNIFTADTLQFNNRYLPSTDGHIRIVDPFQDWEDFACWSDRIGTEKRKEDMSTSMRSILKEAQAKKMWEAECIESSIENEQWWERITFEDHINTKELFFVTEVPKRDFIDGLEISELMINPEGDEKRFEWIELYNSADETINLEGWTIRQKKKSYTFKKQELAAHSYLLIKGTESSIHLPNSQATLELWNPHEELKTEVHYKKSYEAMTFAKNNEALFEWTALPTPERSNVIVPLPLRKYDRDYDGLIDEAERFLGTDPKDFDSDGDHIPDGFEFIYGFDPLSPGNEAQSAYKLYLAEQSSFMVHALSKENSLLFMSGKTAPKSIIKLHIHSKPKVYPVQADHKGEWEFYVPQLESGQHEVFTEIIPQGKIASIALKKQSFHLNENYRAPERKISKKEQGKSSSAEEAINLLSQNYESFSQALETTNNKTEVTKEDFVKTSKKDKGSLWLVLLSSLCLLSAVTVFKYRSKFVVVPDQD